MILYAYLPEQRTRRDRRFDFGLDSASHVGCRCVVRKEYRYVRRTRQLSRFDARQYMLGYALTVSGGARLLEAVSA